MGVKGKRWIALGPAGLLVLFVGIGHGISGPPQIGSVDRTGDQSLKNEVQHAVDRGLQWLGRQQHNDGYWSQPDHPALTALVLTAFMGEPTGRFKSPQADFIQKGYEYLLRCVKPDGGIYVKELTNYNTSVSMMALLMAYNPKYEPVIRKARNFLVGLQAESGDKGSAESVYDGGIGYGSTYPHSDMSNTMFALEALYYTRFLQEDKGIKAEGYKELNWGAALKFIQRCQKLTEYNDQPWASDDPQNRGGFIYFPGDSKSGEMTLPSGKVALRSYGSISYAGLLSYIYAQLERDDPRVKAVYEWLRKNYTLDENPTMGPQGLYYYYHTMAKALSAYGVKTLTLEDGRSADWRRDLAMRFLNLQREDGSWVNENGRWWEKDPVLVTSYAAIAMEIIHKGL